MNVNLNFECGIDKENEIAKVNNNKCPSIVTKVIVLNCSSKKQFNCYNNSIGKCVTVNYTKITNCCNIFESEGIYVFFIIFNLKKIIPNKEIPQT